MVFVLSTIIGFLTQTGKFVLKDIYAHLQQASLFSDLDEEAMRLVASKSRSLKFRANTILMNEGETGESLYLINKGKVKIFITDEDGEEITLFIEGPGSYIGEISLLDNAPRTASAMTLEPSEVISISKKSFVELISENPNIALSIICGLTEKMRRSTENIRSLALRNVYQRLVLKLLELAEEENGKKVITTRYTNRELGKMIGASRETVGKILAELTREEYVQQSQNRLWLLKDFPHDW